MAFMFEYDVRAFIDAGCAVMGLMLGLRAALIAVIPAPMPFMAPVPGDMPVMEGLMPVLTYDIFMGLAVMLAVVLMPDMLM